MKMRALRHSRAQMAYQCNFKGTGAHAGWNVSSASWYCPWLKRCRLNPRRSYK